MLPRDLNWRPLRNLGTQWKTLSYNNTILFWGRDTYSFDMLTIKWIVLEVNCNPMEILWDHIARRLNGNKSSGAYDNVAFLLPHLQTRLASWGMLTIGLHHMIVASHFRRIQYQIMSLISFEGSYHLLWEFSIWHLSLHQGLMHHRHLPWWS